MEFNHNLQNVSPSLTLALNSKVQQLRAQGVDIAGLTVGEPDFPTPNSIKQQAIRAIEENFTRYTAGLGITELREAIVQKLQRDNGLDYKVGNIAVSNGAKHSISNAFYALLNPGDEVILPSPYWLSYPEMVRLCSGTCNIVKTDIANGYKITPEQLAQAIGPQSKILVLNSPNNPTGAVYHEEELAELVPLIKKHNLWVITDEIYEKLVYQEGVFCSLGQFEEIKQKIVLVNGVSKAFAMTGWRIGYIAATEKLIQAVSKIQSNFTSSPCSISQKAAVAALSQEVPEVIQMRKAFARRRELAMEILSEAPEIKIYPSEGAFYLFPQCDAYYGRSYQGKEISNSLQLAEYLLEECHVAVVPGQAFGADENVRISYATSEQELEKGLRRMVAGLQKLE